MTYTPVIHDWPHSCAPLNVLFRAGAQAISGGLTLGGVSISNPEPGGRGELMMEFSAFPDPAQNLEASWLISRITNGAIMRVRLLDSVQLIPALEIAPAASAWLTDAAAPGGKRWTPQAPLSATALAGAVTFSVNTTTCGPCIRRGHVVGFRSGTYEFSHLVESVSYAGTTATLTVSPPLRRGVSSGGYMQLRPAFMGVVRNAAEVAGLFQRGRHVQLGAAQMVEALV